MGSWWKSVVSQVWIEWKCELAMKWRNSDDSKEMESKILMTFRPRIATGGRVGGLQEKNFEGNEDKVEEDEAADDGEKNAEKVWKTMAWATYDGHATIDFEMADSDLAEEQECIVYED